MKSIGIISGAGPYAGLVLHQKIIKLCNDVGCKNDKDFPLIKHLSYPFASTDVNGVIDFTLSKEELAQAITMCSEVDKIALACNSLLPSLSERDRALVFDPRIVIKNKYENLVVLASVSSVESGLYSDISKNIIYPPQTVQQKVNEVISEVMQGNINQIMFNKLISEVKLIYPNVFILLGCTELCVFKDEASTLNILDIIAQNMI